MAGLPKTTLIRWGERFNIPKKCISRRRDPYVRFDVSIRKTVKGTISDVFLDSMLRIFIDKDTKHGIQ